MRLFVGVASSNVIKEQVGLWQEKNRQEEIRMTPPDNLHITIVSPWNTNDAAGAAAKIQSLDFSPFRIIFNRIALNPGRSLIWAAAEIVPPELISLYESCQKIFKTAPECHRFRPHLTLARFRNRHARGVWKNETVSWAERVDNVTLFQSILSPRGATYRQVSALT